MFGIGVEELIPMLSFNMPDTPVELLQALKIDYELKAKKDHI